MAQIQQDYETAALTQRERALCHFAHKLTRTAWQMKAEDLENLRAVGLSDRGILDAVEVISFFNYINRVANALGVDIEPWMQKPR